MSSYYSDFFDIFEDAYGLGIGIIIVILVISLAICVGLAFIPAAIAKNKGYSYGAFWAFGFFLFIPALIVALCLDNKTYQQPPYGQYQQPYNNGYQQQQPYGNPYQQNQYQQNPYQQQYQQNPYQQQQQYQQQNPYSNPYDNNNGQQQ